MGGWELVATDEPAVVSELFLDVIVVENSQGDGCFPNPPCAKEGDRCEGFSETNDLLDQLVTSKTGSWWRGRRLSEYARYKRKVMDSSGVEIADLV